MTNIISNVHNVQTHHWYVSISFMVHTLSYYTTQPPPVPTIIPMSTAGTTKTEMTALTEQQME